MLNFPSQGLNLCPLHWEHRASHGTSREVPPVFCGFLDAKISNCNGSFLSVWLNATFQVCPATTKLCFAFRIPSPSPPTPRYPSTDFPVESYFDSFFFFGRCLLNIALFSKRVLLLFCTTLIKMKANAGVGGTQLNMDLKPWAVNDLHSGSSSSSVSHMINVKFARKDCNLSDPSNLVFLHWDPTMCPTM